MSGAGAVRLVDLPGTYNVRDVGGYPAAGGGTTRWGVLFRGDSLHKLDADGQLRAAGLGLRTILDLRNSDERRDFPSPAAALGAQVISRPLSEPPPSAACGDDLGDRYLASMAANGKRIAEIAALLATAGRLPALVHCMAGKDRTGLVIGIVLSAVGVPDEVVLSDYAESFVHLGPQYRAEAAERARRRGLDDAAIERFLGCDVSHLGGVLAAARAQFGGAGEFLRHHGLAEAELANLRRAVVAGPGATVETVKER